MMKRVLFIALFSLAACDTTPVVVSQAPTSMPSASANAGPGPKDVSPTQAATFFQSGCVDAGPKFANAVQRLDASFVRNTKTGTYYNKSQNLSFNINGKGRTQCSMVFKSGSGEKQLRTAFTKIGHSSALRSSTFSAQGYFRAVILTT